jgi:nicotinate-nucleotide adenylyltransferase
LLGGSYDPVHRGHVELGAYFAARLPADQLRVIPAGLQWQKSGAQATADQRAAMAALAFDGLPCPVVIDRQEIERAARGVPSYTVDTLRNLRAELGPEVCLAVLMGADQLQRLDTWREWRELFTLAHVCVAARPGYELDGAGLPAAVAAEIGQRQAGLPEIRKQAHGLVHLARDFAVEISSTAIRAALQRGEHADSLIPPLVLDYIEQHHLYK